MIRQLYAPLALAISPVSGSSTHTETSETKADSTRTSTTGQALPGCQDSAGYRWSVVQKKCVRLAGTGIRLDPQQPGETAATYLLFATPDDDAQAEIFLPGHKNSLLMPRQPGQNAGIWLLDTLTLRYWKGMHILMGAKDNPLYEGSFDSEASAHAAPVRSRSGVERKLQESWQNLSGPNDTFTINGSKRINSDQGQHPQVLRFAYVADCGGLVYHNRKSRYGCFTTAGKFDIDCQTIIKLSATDLEITQGDTGQIIRY